MTTSSATTTRTGDMIGYARCSTSQQNTDDQVRRLTDAGCVRVFQDVGASGKLASRPEWDRCLDQLRAGDVLALTKLDRGGRSVQHLLKLSNDLAERGVDLKVLDQPIDTTSPAGRLFFTMVAAFAQFERDLIIERTNEGLRTARANGKRPGPAQKLTAKQRATVRKMHGDGHSITAIADTFSCSRPLIYRVLEAAPQQS